MSKRLLALYGDDFTGSSAAMEVLAFAGIRTIMFLDLPSPEQIQRFEDCQAIGIAGIARSKSPSWMNEQLPAFFESLAGFDAAITHYKVCSTFDSSPLVGSIGKAIDLAVPILGGTWHPLLVAAPAINRYQLFGNLFAAVDGVGYRLDRHPTMSRHPVTPMDEADIRLHLSRQTDKPITTIDYLALQHAPKPPSQGEIVAIDCLDEASLQAAGQLIWENRGERLFAAGSQGIEYALVAHWRKIGLIGAKPKPSYLGEAQIAAVSGSCSPITAAQIDRSERDGFALIELNAVLAVDERRWQQELETVSQNAIEQVTQGQNPLIFTARGPDDPALHAFQDAVHGLDAELIHERLGQGLGKVLKNIVEGTPVRRLAIAGGDTSGHALSELGIVALQAIMELAPACAISRAFGVDPRMDGVEIALKGGQMGPEDFFSMIAGGKPANDRDEGGMV